MSLSRREFLQMLAVAAAGGAPLSDRAGAAAREDAFYDLPAAKGSVTLLHFTDCHAQLLPIHFREPDVNLGVHSALGKPPHLVGESERFFIRQQGFRNTPETPQHVGSRRGQVAVCRRPRLTAAAPIASPGAPWTAHQQRHHTLSQAMRKVLVPALHTELRPGRWGVAWSSVSSGFS